MGGLTEDQLTEIEESIIAGETIGAIASRMDLPLLTVFMAATNDGTRPLPEPNRERSESQTEMRLRAALAERDELIVILGRANAELHHKLASRPGSGAN